MFINLVNTDIPFEEYRLTRDQIDALKFNLLQIEKYLDVSDLDEQDCAGERYRVFLTTIDGNLAFLIVSMGVEQEYYGFQILHMRELCGEDAKECGESEILDFVIKSYEKYPERTYIEDTYIGESNLKEIVRSLWDWLEIYVDMHHLKPTEEVKENPVRHHYEANCGSEPKCDWHYTPYSFTPEGKSEIEHLMTIILKKIYNIDYTEKLAEYIESKTDERNDKNQ